MKPSKKAKKNKPSQDPVVTEPALDLSAPDSSTHQPPPEPASDIPVPTFDPPTEDVIHNSDNPEILSPAKTTDQKFSIWKVNLLNRGGLLFFPNVLPRKNLPNVEKPNRTSLTILT